MGRIRVYLTSGLSSVVTMATNLVSELRPLDSSSCGDGSILGLKVAPEAIGGQLGDEGAVVSTAVLHYIGHLGARVPAASLRSHPICQQDQVASVVLGKLLNVSLLLARHN